MVYTLRGVKRTLSDGDSSDGAVEKSRDYNVIGLEDSDTEDEVEKIGEENIVEEETRPDEVKVKEQSLISDPQTIPAEPLGRKPETIPTEPVERKPATYVHVERDAEIQVARLKLPIIVEEQLIMETISENMVTILAGETGR